MAVFNVTERVRSGLRRLRRISSVPFKRLTDRINDRSEIVARIKQGWRKPALLLKKGLAKHADGPQGHKGSETKMRRRSLLVKGVGAAVLFGAVAIGGMQMVQMNKVEVFHVYVGDKEAGIVSDPQVVDDYKLAKVKQLERKYPNVHMVLEADKVVLRGEKAFKKKSDDSAALANLETMLQAHAVGVELKVDGKLVAIVKDQDTAKQVLNQVKAKYAPAAAAPDTKGAMVTKLSAVKLTAVTAAAEAVPPEESRVLEASFVQRVDMATVPIDPGAVVDSQTLMKKLETGDVQPTKYKIQEGDCLGCIAKKFGISKQVIYENNPWLQDDMIKIGQELDLTVLQPTLSVKTVEHAVETQEIQYDTEYISDDSLKAGMTKTILPGRDGIKKVTFAVTKVNGQMMDEQMVDETVIEQPVKAVVKKGTKVIQGEGSGKFAWPVLSASVSSGFGMRWGKLHKGIDLTGNRNIMAADSGKVESAGYRKDYGNYIVIDHLNGYKTLYGHLSKLGVKSGQVVEKGEKIGVMGSTGDSTGVHLHFEVQANGAVKNPLKYLNR